VALLGSIPTCELTLKQINMKKEQLEFEYKQCLENVERSKNELKQAIKDLLEFGKPCEKGDLVKVTKISGETIEGIATTFGILRAEKVYITTLKVGKKTIYISEPYKSISILTQ
jgi:hypothetical protein